jgi:hypothetical protein
LSDHQCNENIFKNNYNNEEKLYFEKETLLKIYDIDKK